MNEDTMLKDTFKDTKVVKTSKTAKEEGSNETVTHNWTFILDGCTVEQIVESAIRSEVIRLQGRTRTTWKKTGKLPADLPAGKVTVKLVDLLSGRSSGIVPTVASLTAGIDTLSDEDREKLIADLMARVAKDQEQDQE